MTTHSIFLVRKISWTEEPGRLWSMGLQRVRHDLSDRPCMLAVKSPNHWTTREFLVLDFLMRSQVGLRKHHYEQS